MKLIKLEQPANAPADITVAVRGMVIFVALQDCIFPMTVTGSPSIVSGIVYEF